MRQADKKFSKLLISVLLLLFSVSVLIGVAFAQSDEKNADDRRVMLDTSRAEISSKRYVQPETETETAESKFTTEGFEKKLESDSIEIWFHRETSAIRIVDKRSGYVWGCAETEQPKTLNKSWFSMASSLFTIEYYDSKEADKRVGLSADKNATYNWSNDSLTVDAVLENIKLSVTLTLSGNRLDMSVSSDSIEELGNEKLKSIYFLPFLGSTIEDEIPGYFVVPDGSGALIRFSKTMEYRTGYSKKIYGPDLGDDTLTSPSGLQASRNDDYLVDEPQVTLPLFGIVHGVGQNAVLSVMANSEEYATLQASVSGILTNYNWISARFDYRQSYMHPTNKAGVGVFRPTPEMYDMHPKQSFYFLTENEASYSGIAVYYRELMEQQGILNSERNDTDVPLRVTVIGAEIEDGFLNNPMLEFTTVEETEKITDDLTGAGINNLTLSYYAWQNGGLNGSQLGSTKWEDKLGSRKDMEALKSKIEQTGRFYLSTNLFTGNETQVNKGKQITQNRSRAFVKLTRPDNTLLFKDYYVTKPDVAVGFINKLSDNYPDTRFHLENMGTFLYGDFTRGNALSRTETKTVFTEISNSLKNLALSTPNLYLVNNTYEYFDAPLLSSQLMFETDTVPFLEIVLKGGIDMYSPYINQGFYSDNMVLRMIEYGVYPSYIVAGADNYLLADTPLVSLFTVDFNDWREHMVNTYAKLNSALKQVEGAKITNHEALKRGLVRVSYDNGKDIYINYNSTPEMFDSNDIPARGWRVVTVER